MEETELFAMRLVESMDRIGRRSDHHFATFFGKAGGTVQQHLPHGAVGLGGQLGGLREDSFLGRLQQAVQAPQNGEG